MNTDTPQTGIDKQDFYQATRADLIARLSADPDQGLSSQEAQTRLEKYGPNKLQEEQVVPVWQKILNQFKDVLIIILIISAIISGAMGELADALIILAIVVVNAILGVVQEGRAEQAIAALQKTSAPEARVLRDGQQVMLPTADLVVGDIVLLEAGDIVPADIRLLKSSNLKAEEASLTGESVPVDKDAEVTAEGELGIGDRHNMLFSSTSVTYGNARGLVVACGEDTEVGNIAASLQSIQQEETPLQVSLNHLGKVLGILVVFVCLIVFAVGLLQGGDPIRLFMTAVSLAVAAIPEGLPAVVTIVLALGMNRMAAQNAIVKRLLAVETLGSIDTICSDKTGTLTQNAMTVVELYAGGARYQVSGSGYAPIGEIVQETGKGEDPLALTRLLEIAALCNDAELVEKESGWDILGDPTEGALLTLAAKAGKTRESLRVDYEFQGDLPFDSDRKAMSVFYAGFPEGKLSLTKGAPDILLEHCVNELVDGELVELTPDRRAEILAENSRMAKKALRVLAFAFKVSADENYNNPEQAMTFVGLTGMIDPPRDEVRDAIAVCHQAGIRVVMITGDYAETALAIAESLHIAQAGDRAVTGQELENMSDQDLEDLVEEVSVFARVSPEHKVRIVRALKRKGHAASMTGDGVNDAPALKLADIGVAMGITGTEVAKSSSDMILTDDNFATIVSAVREGRIIYSNIRKFVSFLLSCNVGEILVVFITNLLLGPAYTPLLPIQLLWLNLVTDSFPALALGQEKGEDDIMRIPPRDREDKIINGPMVRSILVQAVAIFLAVFVAFQLGRYLYPDYLTAKGEVLLDAAGQPQLYETYDFYAHPDAMPSDGARTFAFVTLIFAELIRAYSCRSEHQSVFAQGFFSNASMNKAVFLSLALTMTVLYLPFANVLFHTIHPTGMDLLMMFGLSLIPFAIGEIYKGLKYKH